MKKHLILSTVLCLAMLLLPFLSTCTKNTERKAIIETETNKIEAADSLAEEVQVMRSLTGETVSVNLFDYLVGTVAGEMPASFSEEALKAQAVVSYTYAKWLTDDRDNNIKYITDSASLHQKYIDKEEQKEKWQNTYDENRKIIENAVRSVYGEYLSYNGETAMTVFHALSNGTTLSAYEVWGNEVPYLKAVEAPGDVIAEKYESVVSFSADEMKKLFEKEGIKFENTETKNLITVKAENKKGYADILTVSSDDFTAREIRKMLSLPGNSFKLEKNEDNIIFTVHGRGHGVGMSQYSADYMARQGKTYREILAHFYPGTKLEKE